MSRPLQHKIFDFIKDYIETHGYSPALRDIARGIGIGPKSQSLVSRHVHALAASGRLSLGKGGYRNIRLAERPAYSLPLLGKIAAGTPIEAIEQQEQIDFAPLLQGDDRFVLEVKGDSMIDLGIHSGDWVICRRAMHAQEGDIVVALIDEQEATLKRISYQIQERVTLIPANATLKPKAYLPQRVQVQGVMLGLLRLLP